MRCGRQDGVEIPSSGEGGGGGAGSVGGGGADEWGTIGEQSMINLRGERDSRGGERDSRGGEGRARGGGGYPRRECLGVPGVSPAEPPGYGGPLPPEARIIETTDDRIIHRSRRCGFLGVAPEGFHSTTALPGVGLALRDRLEWRCGTPGDPPPEPVWWCPDAQR